MNPIVYVIGLTLLSLSLVSCDKEEDDFISEPTVTSTIITGRVCTPEGTPFAGIPVTVDYDDSGMFSYILRHKAKGMTDKNGYYRVFFNLDEKEIDAGGLCLSMDLAGVSTEKYLMPFSDSKVDFNFKGKDKVGKTLECNITIPRKKEMQVSIVTEGADLEEGEYALTHTFSYGSGWEWSKFWNMNLWGNDVASDITVQEPITISGSGSNTVTFQCAMGEPNIFQLVYRKTSNDSYQIVNEKHRIDVTDNSGDEIKLVYNLPSVEKFKIQLLGDHKPLFSDASDGIAPMDKVNFDVVNGHGVFDSSFAEAYDSLVWSAKGLPDTYTMFAKDTKPLYRNFSTCFYNEGDVTNYLSGYRDGKIVYSDSIVVAVRNRDFLCFKWDSGKVKGEPFEYADNALNKKYGYCITNPYYTDDVVKVSRITVTGSLTSEEVKAALLSLLEGAGVEKVDIDFLTLRNIFSRLPGNIDPVEFYENESTRVLLLRYVNDDSGSETYSLHVEAK